MVRFTPRPPDRNVRRLFGGNLLDAHPDNFAVPDHR